MITLDHGRMHRKSSWSRAPSCIAHLAGVGVLKVYLAFSLHPSSALSESDQLAVFPFDSGFSRAPVLTIPLCSLQEDIGKAAAVVETLRPAFQVAVDKAAQHAETHTTHTT